MKANKITIILAAAALFCLASCDKFLDVNPDKRAEMDTAEEVGAILGSAYTDHVMNLLAEMMGDNIDDFGETSFNKTIRFLDQIYNYEEITESNNESPENCWSDYWSAIAATNVAIQTLDSLGNKDDRVIRELYGEAYIARAFNYFTLASIFCMAYDPEHASTDPGLPYLREVEKGFNVIHDRGTVAELYENIEKDIELGLPLIGDSHYRVPKYHFNSDAAYAFACRFYLYYGKYDKAIECANRVLGESPATILKDWKTLGGLPTGTNGPLNHSTAYCESSSPANLLLQACYSIQGFIWSNYSTYNRYAHGSYLSSTEDMEATHPWGKSTYYDGVKTYTGSMDKIIFWRVPYIFQYKDPVANTGWYRTISVALTTDETLLNRAEAYILKGDFDAACADMNLWLHNMTQNTTVLTPANIKSFYNGVAYYQWDKATVKKHLSPAFISVEEGSDLECMLQCLLNCKRLETIGFGGRWQDIRRYGITVHRRKMGLTKAGYVPISVTDEITPRDPRLALQIPYKVIQGGFAPNPR